MPELPSVGERIPIVVLGGWLGSGKTTLLNRLLTAGNAGRLAVVVNDVGDINIDARLIARHDGETVELTDGCICCSIGDSLAVTLRDIVMQARPPDGIVIEASGIADPDKVAAYGDRRRVHGDLIAVTIDAAAVCAQAAHPTYGRLVHRQVESADVLLLTKTDLTSGDRASEWLRQTAPTTRIVDVQQQPGLALATLTPSTASAQAASLAGPSSTPPVADEPTADRFATRTWHPTDPAGLPNEEIEAILADAVDSGLIRAKGIVGGPEGPRLVHVAGHRISIKATSQAPTGIVTIWAAPEPPAEFGHRQSR